MQTHPNGDDVLTVTGASQEAIGQLAFDNRIVLYEITGEGSSLEEVFLDLTTPDEEVGTMTALIRSELLAVRTLRTTWILPVALLALVGLIVGASMGDAGKPGTITPDQLREPLAITAGIMSAVFVAVFAVIRVGGEYRYETISQRFLAGSRARVVAAKLVTFGGLGAVLAALSIGLGLAIAAPMIASKDLTSTTPAPMSSSWSPACCSARFCLPGSGSRSRSSVAVSPWRCWS